MHIGYLARQLKDRWGQPLRTEGSELIEVANKTGGPLSKATLVYVSGYDSTLGCPTVAKADADASLYAEAVLVGAIANNAKGVAMLVGQVGGQNTNAATVGDPVYLSDTAGAWALAAPAGVDKLVQVVGYVQVKSATVGVIRFVIGRKAAAKLGSSALIDASIGGVKLAAGFHKLTLAAGTDSAANVTIAGMAVGDEIVSVLSFVTAAAIATVADRTAEYVAGAGVATKAGGTDDRNNQLVFFWLDKT